MIYTFIHYALPPIGHERDGVFTWGIAPASALHIAQEFAEEACVADGRGKTYTGDGFWELAGQWEWDRSGVR